MVKFWVWCRRGLGIAVFCAIAGLRSTATADEALVKRFIEEAPKKWQEYKSIFHRFDVQEDAVTEDLVAKQETRDTIRIVSSTDGTQAMMKVSRRGKRERLIGDNPNYQFELRKDTGPKDVFSIDHVTPPRRNAEGIALRDATYVAKSLWRVSWLLDFLTIVPSRDFHVKDATEIAHNGKRLVKVQFEYHLRNPAPKERSLPKSYTGTALFDPDSYWALYEVKMNVDDPFKKVGAIEVDHQVENRFRDLPVVVEERVRWVDLKGTLCQRATWKYQWQEFTGDNEVFTLSGYGFPEPTFGGPSRSRMWSLVICTTLLVFCIALFVYRQWRKLKAARRLAGY